MMNNKILLAIFLLTILSVELAHGLSCYQHDTCVGGCPTLASSIVQCQSSQSKCWKLSSPIGTKRGCGDNRCMIQLDTGFMGTASVCCSGDLCNSGISIKATTIIVLISLFAFLFVWRM